jgi:hypothetical protein
VQTLDGIVTDGWSAGDGARRQRPSGFYSDEEFPEMNRRIVTSVLAFALALPVVACEPEKPADKPANDKDKGKATADVDKTKEPAKVEPAKVEPAKEEPAKAEPGKEEPAKAEPAKEEPAKAEPGKEPAKTDAKAEPAKGS